MVIIKEYGYGNDIRQEWKEFHREFWEIPFVDFSWFVLLFWITSNVFLNKKLFTCDKKVLLGWLSKIIWLKRNMFWVQTKLVCLKPKIFYLQSNEQCPIWLVIKIIWFNPKKLHVIKKNCLKQKMIYLQPKEEYFNLVVSTNNLI